MFMALVDQVLDALAGTKGEMVFFPKGQHTGDGPPSLFTLSLGKRGYCTARRLQSTLDDFLGRTAHTAGQRCREQLLPVR